jgi:hypothetical protein
MATNAQIEAAAAAVFKRRQKELGHKPPLIWDDFKDSLTKQAAEYRRYAKIAIEAAEKASQ